MNYTTFFTIIILWAILNLVLNSAAAHSFFKKSNLYVQYFANFCVFAYLVFYFKGKTDK